MRLRFIILVLLALLITAGFVGAVSATSEPVISSFSLDKSSGTAPLTIKFTWVATNATSYTLEYGDGNTYTGSGTSQTHIYDTARTTPYIAKLTAINTDGTDEEEKTVTVSEKQTAPPVPTLTISPDTTKGITTETTVTFTFSSEGATSYEVDFGDGSTHYTGNSGETTHKYATTNSKTVIVKAFKGTVSSQTTKIITVNDPVIKTINVKVGKPIPGNTQGSGTTETPGVIIESTSWSPDESNNKFDEEEKYTVTVKVKPVAGYKFSTSTTTPITAKINSISADIDDDSKSENSLTFSYEFDATTTIIDNDIYLTITEPMSGVTPNKKIKSSTSHVDADNSEVTWSPSDATFKAGKDYTATIIVPPSKDYSFESKPTVYLNDDKLSSSEVSITTEGRLKVIHKFTNDISEVYLTITEPSVGEKPDTKAEAKDSLVTVNNPITWSPDDTTFSAGDSYKVTINVNVKSTLEYADSVTYYINNKIADVIDNNDGSYDITYKFKTAIDISKIVITLDSPIAGSSAPSRAQISSNPFDVVEGTVSWSPSVSTFGSDTAYTANIKVNTISGYRFTSSTTATVNGDTAKVTGISDSSVTVSYTYPRTAKVYTDVPTIEPTQTQTPETTSSGEDTSIPNPIGIIHELVKLFLSMFDFNNYVMAETPAAAEQ